jgi:hypothetical protein
MSFTAYKKKSFKIIDVNQLEIGGKKKKNTAA